MHHRALGSGHVGNRGRRRRRRKAEREREKGSEDPICRHAFKGSVARLEVGPPYA